MDSDKPDAYQGVTMEEVWGTFDLEKMERTSKGMVVAQGYGEPDDEGYFTKEQYVKCVANIPDVCPIWGDKLGYKSVTVVCSANLVSQVLHWLTYVHGSNCVSKMKPLVFGRMAIRSDYQCW